MKRRTVTELLAQYKTASEVELVRPSVQSPLGNELRKLANEIRNLPEPTVSIETVHAVKQASEQGLNLKLEDPITPVFSTNKLSNQIQKIAYELRKLDVVNTRQAIKTAHDVLTAARGLTLLGALREDVHEPE